MNNSKLISRNHVNIINIHAFEAATPVKTVTAVNSTTNAMQYQHTTPTIKAIPTDTRKLRHINISYFIGYYREDK
jgi:hypothetical protein